VLVIIDNTGKPKMGEAVLDLRKDQGRNYQTNSKYKDENKQKLKYIRSGNREFSKRTIFKY
jgi:hypothetical protein